MLDGLKLFGLGYSWAGFEFVIPSTPELSQRDGGSPGPPRFSASLKASRI
jgi:hypothetical protein